MPAVTRSLFEGIRHPEKVRLPKRPRHEFDPDWEVADESGWDCNRGEAKTGLSRRLFPKPAVSGTTVRVMTSSAMIPGR